MSIKKITVETLQKKSMVYGGTTEDVAWNLMVLMGTEKMGVQFQHTDTQRGVAFKLRALAKMIEDARV